MRNSIWRWPLWAMECFDIFQVSSNHIAASMAELIDRRRMKGSLLDDCPGMSPARKQQPLERFGSVIRLCNATPEAIAELLGISRKTVESILSILSKSY